MRAGVIITGLAGLALGLLAIQGASAQQAEGVVVDEVRLVDAEESAPVLGRLVSRQAGNVAARVSAPVARYLVAVGDRVSEGDLLVKLDDSVLSVRRDQAAATLAEAEALVESAKAEQGLAWQELNRLEQLQSSPAFSQARYEDQRQAVAVAAANVRVREAAVHGAETDLALTELELSYTEVRAPYRGVVLQRFSEAGAYVTGGQPLIALLAADDLEIEADVPFQQIAGLTEGDEVPIQFSDGTTHSAIVRAIIPNENPLTRTRAVRFVPSIGETNTEIAAGQSVTLLLPTGRNGGQALTVHKDAVIPQTGRNVVFVVQQGTAESRDVEIGRSLGDRFEILSGLSAGELAVVRGNERLRAGQPIEVTRQLEGSNGAAQ